MTNTESGREIEREREKGGKRKERERSKKIKGRLEEKKTNRLT